VNCTHCKIPSAREFCSYYCETEHQRKVRREAMRESKTLLYDGRACKQCNGNMTSEDHRYCSDKCREEVRGSV
jgi:predicted nucleic acid-binding Zn ribbon protein